MSEGIRRAVSGVVAALPGQDEPDQDLSGRDEPGTPAPEQAPDAPDSALAAAPATRSSRSSTARARTSRSTPPRSGTAGSSPAGSGAQGTAGAQTGTAPAEPAPLAAPDAAVPQEPAPTWSDEELAGFRKALDAEVVRLREELDMGEADLADLVADSGDGAGDDQADAGSKTFEREHEMSVNANTREMLEQALRALRRLEAGTYGICESCGQPIKAGRLRAYPRATLCITCKQAEERR
jgi:RNA polymerase-binding protein DksA